MADDKQISLPPALFWIQDAPLFADVHAIDQFYNAIANPQFREGNIALEISEETVGSLQGKLKLGAEITTTEFASLLAPLFAFMKPKLTGEAAVDGKRDHSSGKTTTIELESIKSPERQLRQLALYYLINKPNHIYFPEALTETTWREPASIAELPRSLVFLSLPGAEEAKAKSIPQSKLIPTAAEFADGSIELIYNDLQFGGGDAPRYPDKGSEAELQNERKEYWKWFDKNFSATQAMTAVERAASKHGRIRWIDYRLPISESGDTLHLHVCPAAEYDTGVLAYNFIKRGFKHGVRLVGTLKSEPDLNVLAIYER